MKIVQINTFPYKATGNIMMGIHNLLVKNGYDSYVVWGRGRGSENSHEIVIADKLGVNFHGIQVISRGGAQAYASAAANSHPGALQISDRFHLLKNLSGAVEEYMYRLFPSRLAIPSISQNPEMQALYDTRNRTERILFARKKRSEGYTVNDIALLLYSSETPVSGSIRSRSRKNR